MNTAQQIHDVPLAPLFRSFGRVSAVFLFATWAGLFSAEVIQGKVGEPPVNALLQAAAVATIFAGYAIGWRHELAGGLMAIAGTAAFFVVVAFTIPTYPGVIATFSGISATVFFATPGVLYLLAWRLDRQRAKLFRG